MKRRLRVLAVIVILVLVGVAVLIAAADIDRYRPMVVSRLESALGRPVRLERISLGWKRGLAIRLTGFSILEGAVDGGTVEPLISVESASALVQWRPLLRKEVRISSVVFQHPRIHASRDAQGRINLTGLAAVGGPSAASQRPIVVGGRPVSFQIASLRIEHGSLHWTDATTKPPRDLWLRAVSLTMRNMVPGRPMEIELVGALGDGRGDVRLAGRFTPPGMGQEGSLEQVLLDLHDVRLEDVAPPAAARDPALRGRVTMTLRGRVPTLDPAQLLRAASGSGTVQMVEAVVMNFNMLREVFERFSMLPGLVQALQARLPPEYQTKLAARDTVLAPLDVAVQVEHGSLRFDALHVRADAFAVTGSGRVGFDGALQVRSLLRIDPALSAALIRSVNELQALTDHQGQMEIPLIIEGRAPRLTILPDVSYVASKLIATKAKDLLGDLLGKALDRQTSPSSAPPTP